jgi:inosose dehydratase
MFAGKNVKLGIAPIAWTNDDLPELGSENTFQQCVSEMALAGFTGSEIGNKYPKDAKVLKAALDLRGMEICNAWFSTFLITKPYEETEAAFEKHVAFLAAMGAKVVGVSEQSYSTQGIQTQPVFEGKYVMNDEEWALLCDGLNRLGKLSQEKYGIKLTYHHHMGTVVQTAAETDRLMEGTDPSLVGLLYDCGHFAYCGEDYMDMLVKYANRIQHVHLKDIRPEVIEVVRAQRLSFLDGVRLGTFTIPGDGSIDFDPIFKVLADVGYEGYMLVEAEQDPAKADPLEYAIRARKFIAEHTGL